jgi:hypothetical protein
VVQFFQGCNLAVAFCKAQAERLAEHSQALHPVIRALVRALKRRQRAMDEAAVEGLALALIPMYKVGVRGAGLAGGAAGGSGADRLQLSALPLPGLCPAGPLERLGVCLLSQRHTPLV